MNRVVIVGGVAGGATAAARIRRLDERAEITVYEKSGFISYANCGLPYYIGGEIINASDLTLQTPESFFSRFRVDVKVHHEVVAIDTVAKNVTVKNLGSGEVFVKEYDKLILSTGAKPIRPPFSGIDSEGIFTLRTVEDTLNIKKFILSASPAQAVVVGGGFIGIEMAENLARQGISVTVVEGGPQLMAPFDSDMAAFIHGEMRRNGVKVMLNSMVEGFNKSEGRLNVCLKGGVCLPCDMAILAIGVSPDARIAQAAGIATGIKGSIVVDDHMRTSAPDVYAVGDAVQIKNFVTGRDTLISLAGPANKQGRVAADNVCGLDSSYTGGQGSSVIKIFDMTAACTGINERTAAAEGIEVRKVILSPLNHAGYYPGGRTMTMKVIFSAQDWRVLGAQILGYDGVDKRIDVLATAIRAGMTADDLAELDLAYAPPYSSAKDPVNMAGFIAQNLRDGVVRQWYYEDADSLPRDGSVTLLDVRTRGEYSSGHIEGFINIPVDDLRSQISSLDVGKRVYVICQSGLRSYIAARILEGNGFEAYNFAGGYRFYDTVKNDRVGAQCASPCGKEN